MEHKIVLKTRRNDEKPAVAFLFHFNTGTGFGLTEELGNGLTPPPPPFTPLQDSLVWFELRWVRSSTLGVWVRGWTRSLDCNWSLRHLMNAFQFVGLIWVLSWILVALDWVQWVLSTVLGASVPSTRLVVVHSCVGWIGKQSNEPNIEQKRPIRPKHDN